MIPNFPIWSLLRGVCDRTHRTWKILRVFALHYSASKWSLGHQLHLVSLSSTKIDLPF